MKQSLSLNKTPRNILIISMRYLGDVLLTTPLIKTIKMAYPDANVDVLVYSHTAAMLEGNTDIRQVISTPQRPTKKAYFKVVKEIFRQYDLAIVTQTGDRRFIYALLAASTRIGVVPQTKEKGAWKRIFMQGWVEFDSLNNHTVLEFLSLAELLGIPAYTQLIPPRSDTFNAPAECKNIGLYAVIHLLPQWKYKQWHNRGWIETINHLKKQGMSIVFSGSNNKDEVAAIDAIRAVSPSNTFNMAGKVSLAGLSHIISRATLFIGPDTGITHLAAATGVPVIALFGPTNPAKWGPWPINYRHDKSPFTLKGSQQCNNVFLLQEEKECVPCFLEGCDRHQKSESECLNHLSSARVIQCINQILDK